MMRLVLLVEGDGDYHAAPALIKRLISEQEAWDAVILDEKPMKVGGFPGLAKDEFAKWRRFLSVAAKRRQFGGCLLLLDGDCRGKFENEAFCAMRAAQRLSQYARDVGAGTIFSVASVFACREYESWLIAGVESLRGKALPDGRQGVRSESVVPEGDLEQAPRDAKGWLSKNMQTGYSEVRDQADLTTLVDLQMIRDREMRSFRRLESAIRELVTAMRSGEHTVTPLA